MLGFGPISSSPISGSPFKLIAVPLEMSADVSLTLDVSARGGIYIPMRATIQVGFGTNGFLSTNQALSGTATLTFGGISNLRVAGKPLIVSAIPVSFTLCAPLDRYTVKAIHEPFTARGVK